jgi:hypothetical protein
LSLNFVFRAYEDGDEERIVELLDSVFDGWPKIDLSCDPVDHWRWKYLDNPQENNAIGIATHDGEIVGCDHGFFLRVKIGDRIVRCQQGTDSAVHEAYRGLKLWSGTNDVKNDLMAKFNTSYTYWATVNPIFIKTSKRRGYPAFPHPVLNMVRINNFRLHHEMEPMENYQIKKLGFIALSFTNRISNFMPSFKVDGKSEYEVRDIEKFDVNINNFWDKIKEHYNFIVVRDRSYLNWRYCDPRVGSYHIKEAEQDGVVLGYIVFRINSYRGEYPNAAIMDLLTLPEREDVADDLLKTAIEDIDRKGVNITYAWGIRNNPITFVLNRYGFVNSWVKLDVRYRSLDAGEELDVFVSSSPEQIHFQIGDTDWI